VNTGVTLDIPASADVENEVGKEAVPVLRFTRYTLNEMRVEDIHIGLFPRDILDFHSETFLKVCQLVIPRFPRPYIIHPFFVDQSMCQ
jgi:hypothetical protein